MLSDLRTQVDDLVQDDTGKVSIDGRDRAIVSALTRLSEDRPRADGSPHVVSDTEDTVPGDQREAVASYAASLLLDGLSAKACGNTDSTISADSVNRTSQAAEYAARARTYRKRYAELLKLDDSASPAGSGAVTAWPSRRKFVRYR